MKNVIRLEEVAMTAISFYFISLLTLSFPWWLYLVIFFSPDIGMLGYLISNKIGAITYNLFHHKAIAVIVGAIGIVFNLQYVIFAGIILFAHSSFDRILGYGLKYFSGFKQTHLGEIGQ